jgi:predicted transcriptional regulator
MVSGGSDTRYEIFKILVSAKKIMTLSSIAQKMNMDQQRVAYHLPFLVDSGLIIRKGNEYFPQPVFLNEKLHALCAEKLSDIVEGFSDSDNSIVVGKDQDRNEVVLTCLYALVKLTIPEQI